MKKAQPKDESREIEEQAALEDSAAAKEPEQGSAADSSASDEPVAAESNGSGEPQAEGEDGEQPMLPHVLPNPTERRALLEAIVYVAEEPVSPEQIAEALKMPVDVVHGDLEKLAEETASDTRGIEVRKVAGGYKMFTKAEHHEAIRGFVKTLRPKLRLSLPALETLAVVAYKQPVTVPEIQAIRGVNAGGVIHTLLNHKLITTAGRKKVIGRPMQYKTTKEFLVQFGLNDLTELPNLKELEELSRAALGEGEEPEGSAAEGSETDPISENGAGVAGGSEESVEEASTEEAADEATDGEEHESASSPIAALSAAVGGTTVAPPRPDEESEEDSDD